MTVAPAHAASAAPARPGWSLVLPGGPWGVAADRAGCGGGRRRRLGVAVTPSGRRAGPRARLDVTEAPPALSADGVLVGGEAGVTLLDRSTAGSAGMPTSPVTSPAVTLAGDVALAGDDSGVLPAFDAAPARRGGRSPAPEARAGAPGRRRVRHGRRHLARGNCAPGRGPRPRHRRLPLVGRRSGPDAAAPALGRDVVVVAVGDGHFTARVEARDLASGALRWRTPVPASFERAIEPAAGGDEVVVVDHFGTVTALDLADGERRWTRPLGEPVLATRVGAHPDRVVLTTYGGTVALAGRVDGSGRVSGPGRLAGYPVAGALVGWRGGRGTWPVCG